MKVHFFERQLIRDQISIEKLFGIIQQELTIKGVDIRIFKNPYPLKKMLAAMWYFRKNQGEINHITGDIHWAALLLDPNKTVLTIHDTVGLETLRGWKRKLYLELWLKLPLKKVRYITVISEKTRQEIISELPWAQKKLRVIPNCVTADITSDIRSTHNAIPRILIIGTRANKNLERIIPALKGLKVEVTIVGKLSEKQEELLHQHAVIFSGFENLSDIEIADLYDASDILCFPSLYEGFGLPILEAQARNCAVITSDRSPMKEVAGDAALLVDPEDPEQIRGALLKFIEEPELYRSLINHGKVNVKNYLPAEIAQKYIDLYNEIISNK